MASSEHITFILNIHKVKLFFQQIQTGLTNNGVIRTIVFDDAVTARYIRVNPVEWNHWPSFRFELIGCRMYCFHCLIICIFFSLVNQFYVSAQIYLIFLNQAGAISHNVYIQHINKDIFLLWIHWLMLKLLCLLTLQWIHQKWKHMTDIIYTKKASVLHKGVCLVPLSPGLHLSMVLVFGSGRRGQSSDDAL